MSKSNQQSTPQKPSEQFLSWKTTHLIFIISLIIFILSGGFTFYVINYIQLTTFIGLAICELITYVSLVLTILFGVGLYSRKEK